MDGRADVCGGEPLAAGVAWSGVARCVPTALGLLLQGRIHRPRRNVGRTVCFADGTSARVYRETTLTRAPAGDPCALVVGFVMRGVRGRRHAVFERESLLHTPLFVGFPGFVSKLWLSRDDSGRYRGVYEWDGPAWAGAYAGSVWHLLALVSEPGSIGFRVFAGWSRDDVLDDPDLIGAPPGDHSWWHPVAFS